MKRYSVKLVGVSDLLMHRDNIQGSENIKAWQKDPKNKKMSVAGDDRTPARTWITYVYEKNGKVVIDSDNLMSCFRDAGKKCPAATGKGSLKALTQTGIMVDQLGWELLVDGAPIPYDAIMALWYEDDFTKHEQLAKDLGFELFVKRAKIGTSKHVRVRPRFSRWSCEGTITVTDTSLTLQVLENILEQAGSMVGLCDWRPGSPSAPGQYGRFKTEIKEI